MTTEQTKLTDVTSVRTQIIERALRLVVGRCVQICRNLNESTFGHERGTDCARSIDAESEAIIAEALSAIWNNTAEGQQFLKNALASSFELHQTSNTEPSFNKPTDSQE
jgi:hypothetical protein